MKNFKILFFLFSIILLLSFVPKTKESGSIVGRWSKDAGIIWEIRSDGTYTLTFSGGGPISGIYNLKDNQIIISDLPTAGSAMGCLPQQKGSYTFQIEPNDKSMVITKVNETCSEREGVMPGTYNRQ